MFKKLIDVLRPAKDWNLAERDEWMKENGDLEEDEAVVVVEPDE